MFNELLKVFFVTFLPFGELRASIPLGMYLGINIFLVYLVAVIANILIIFLTFFFLDHVHHYFLFLGLISKILY